MPRLIPLCNTNNDSTYIMFVAVHVLLFDERLAQLVSNKQIQHLAMQFLHFIHKVLLYRTSLRQRDNEQQIK